MEKPINISDIIAEFRDVVVKSWPNVEALAANDPTESLKTAWLQSCWERLAEHALSKHGLVRLEIYGEGADIDVTSSRVSFPTDQATHQVHCIPSEGNIGLDVLNDREVLFDDSGYLFDRFVSVQGGWHYDSLPLDHVLLDSNGSEAVFKLDRVKFILVRKST